MTRRRRGSEEIDAASRLDDGTATLRVRELEKGAVINRRGVLWRAGLAGAAGAVALTALDDQRAEAATGGGFVLGQANDASSTTSLTSTVGITQGFSNLMSLDGSSNITVSALDVKGPSAGTAVYGHVDSGAGVFGSSTSGTGTTGTSTSGTGVAGTSIGGTGVSATSGTGTALSVTGKTHFSRSGSALVAQGKKSASVNVSGMTGSSLVLVTLQVSVTGVYITSAVPAAGKFTVHLNKSAPTKMKFAWFVLSG